MNKNTKVLITGGAGYLGSVLTPHLLEKNFKVTVVDTFQFSETSLNSFYKYKNLEIIRHLVTLTHFTEAERLHLLSKAISPKPIPDNIFPTSTFLFESIKYFLFELGFKVFDFVK